MIPLGDGLVPFGLGLRQPGEQPVDSGAEFVSLVAHGAALCSEARSTFFTP
jgi:hypothetical protein